MLQKVNRFAAQSARLNHRQKSVDSSQRKAETRTKIQLGGLILKSGIADLLNIEPGDDLQLDPTNFDKAAVVLGILIEATQNLYEKKDAWEFLGRKHLKYEFTKQHSTSTK